MLKKLLSKRLISFFVTSFLFFGVSMEHHIVFGQFDVVPTEGRSDSFVTRGEAVSKIVNRFDLKKKEAHFIQSCMTHMDECFFVFSAISRFDNIQFMPLQLYPDVTRGYRYYDDVNLATMLELVHGCIDEKDSPFHPRANMRRIDALKVVLGATGLIHWKERFEIAQELGSEEALNGQKTPYSDVTVMTPGQWWYPRYVNFAYNAGIIPHDEIFRPEAYITPSELNEMIQNAQKKVAAP